MNKSNHISVERDKQASHATLGHLPRLRLLLIPVSSSEILLCFLNLLISLSISLFVTFLDLVCFFNPSISHSISIFQSFRLFLFLARGEDLIQTAWRAGATSGLNCSLCQAGTYLTGFGET